MGRLLPLWKSQDVSLWVGAFFPSCVTTPKMSRSTLSFKEYETEEEEKKEEEEEEIEEEENFIT